MKRFLFLVVFGVFFTATANAQTIAAGTFHTLTICVNGTVMSYGDNREGMLGDGTLIKKITPISISGLYGVISVDAGDYHSIFLKQDGTVWGCGKNSSGQLGDGTDTSRLTPVQVNGVANIIGVSVGENHSLFLKNDGTVWGCGDNSSGQLGDGTNTSRLTPVQVNGLDNIIDIDSDGYSSMFLTEDGDVWGCGTNQYGKFGNGTNIGSNVPVIQADGLTNVVAIAVGQYHSLFLKNDGTVWSSGYNYYGQLGDNTNTDKLTPIQVDGITNATDIDLGTLYSIILKEDGTVWGCGNNSNGQLGDGTGINRYTPVQTINLCHIAQPNKPLYRVFGLTYLDINENCIREVESGINKRKAIIQPGNIIVETNTSGYWYIDSLAAGTYTITVDTTGKWRPTCDVTQSFTVTDPDGLTQAPSFGLVSTEPCSEPNVNVYMPFMRPGFSGQKVYVKACNDYIATGALVNGYVDVVLDDLITVNNASLSYTALGDNTFRFNIGTINPGQCVSYDMSTTVSTSAVLGQTLCLEALLYPVENCVLDTIPTPTPPDFTSCDLPWDKSSILVEGECINDSIVFTITNTGDPVDGDMDCFSPVRLYIDGEYIWLDSLKLNGGETFTYTFAGDGRTWRLEVDQHPLHPGHSRPNATIERCGYPSNWTPDLVNILPHDDEDPIKDIYCGIVTGSYDPNDKTGYPLGVGEDHLIEPNRKMEYVIRFQNTGTDTAFTVKILDTLDTDLDIFSVRSGVSSHNYSFRMHGPRVLEWTFSNIKLPDSTTNEPESNGFVTFTVNQVKNLPDGTEINNRVGIYFDFNDPIITNTTSHIIGRPIKTASWTEEQTLNVEDCAKVTYGNIDYTKSGTYWQVNKGIMPNPDTLTTLNVTIKNTKHSITESVCDSFTAPDGQIYTTSGMKTAIIPNFVGCDSIISIDLKILNTQSSITESVCDSFTAPDGQVYTTSGMKTAIIPNTVGCDSTITIDLTIKEATNYSFTESVCDSYTAPDGQIYTTSGIKTAIIPNAVGCDSTITIDLTIKEATSYSFSESVCDSYTAPDGQVYTTSGLKTAIIPNAVGCDSTIMINLTISPDLSVSQTGNTLTANATSATYQWVDCDNGNTAISEETNQSFTPSISGNYAVIVTQNGCTDASECQSITVLGTTDTSASLSMTKIYPNPNRGNFTVAFGQQLNSAIINVTDILGKTVYTTIISGDRHNVQLNEAKGIYFVNIQTEQGERTTLKLIVE